MTTKIEWVKNPDGTKGETWNPVTGCTKVSPGCKNCYAERMAKRLAGRYGYPEQPNHFDVTLHPDKLDLPLRWRKPRQVFVCSMGDLFHKDVPEDYIVDVFARMLALTEHTFQVLTKRADRMCDFVTRRVPGVAKWSNIHFGTSIENQATADERIPWLIQTPAAVRFVSAEPLLGAVDLDRIPVPGMDEITASAIRYSPDSFMHVHPGSRLDWLIVGGESGPGARPMHPDWARSLVQQCKSASVPVFVKQMGTVWAKSQYLQGKSLYAYGDTRGHEMKYWPEDLRVREMPGQEQEVAP